MCYALLDVYRVGDNIVTDTYNGSPTANAAVDELLTLDAESGVEDCGQAVMAAAICVMRRSSSARKAATPTRK